MAWENFLGLWNSIDEALDYIQKDLQDKKAEEASYSLLKDLDNAAKFMLAEIERREKFTLQESMRRYILNARYSMEKIFKGGDFFPIFSYEVRLFFLSLHELMKTDDEMALGVDTYRELVLQRAREAKKKVGKGHYKYKVSIVLIGYNKLEYTKVAAESIFKYTDFSKGDVELITVNNGSTDGTEEYFNSLPHVKKVNLKYNLIPAVNVHYICEGQYVVWFSNDVVATMHWLEGLLTCIESANDIAIVVPTCNGDSITNYQGVSVPYSNNLRSINYIYSFAQKYNCSDDKKWLEYIKVIPFVSIWPREIGLCHIVDYRYNEVMFSDDDTAIVFRRTGWRQILAKDTFLHHFGSITLRKEKKSSLVDPSVMIRMANVYAKKWGIYPWEGLNNCAQYDMLLKNHGTHTGDRILFIEPLFGETCLLIRNLYRQAGQKLGETTAIVVDSRFREDVTFTVDREIVESTLEMSMAKLEGKFDRIIIGAFLGNLPVPQPLPFLEKLYSLLNPGGLILTSLYNAHSAYTIHMQLERDSYNELPMDALTEFRGNVSATRLGNLLRAHSILHDKFKLLPIGFSNDEPAIEQIARSLFHEVDKGPVHDFLFPRHTVLSIWKP